MNTDRVEEVIREEKNFEEIESSEEDPQKIDSEVESQEYDHKQSNVPKNTLNILSENVQDEEKVPSSISHKNLVLWRHPALTLFYCFKELFYHTKIVCQRVTSFRKIISFSVLSLVVFEYLNNYSVSNQTLVDVQQKMLWCLYWFSLGVLSSFGLGTGLHTFALYLGPHIASVTLAANECGYLNFEEHPSQTVECPVESDPWAAALWNIMRKVRLESYMWGLGTAVGELPPYFMGRAARISGGAEIDILREVEALDRRKDGCPESLSWLDKIKLCVRDLVKKAGFWGILTCASIPNPFFDLAGITCGSFMVPFWTFFGATVIGKAVIKTTLQQVFVILSFNKHVLTWVFEVLSEVPLVGHRLETHFAEYIAKQKLKFSEEKMDDTPVSVGWCSMAYHGFVICAFVYCFISMINSLAQSNYKRLERVEENKSK